MATKRLYRVEYEDGGEWFPDRGWVPDAGVCFIRAFDSDHAAELFYDRTQDTMSEGRRVVGVTRVRESDAAR